jgi:FkbH-like protein
MPTVVSATFTIDTPVFARTLREAWCAIDSAIPQPQKIHLLDYNRVLPELENPDSLTATNASGYNVLLLRFEDFLRFKKPDISNNMALTTQVNKLLDAFQQTATRSTLPFIVVICPDSNATLADADYLTLRNKLMTHVEKTLKQHRNAHLVTEDTIKIYYPNASPYDGTSAELDREGHIPFTDTYYTALARSVGRKISAIERARHTPLKLIILDCDNTLYQGVASEGSVVLTPAFHDLQELMVKQRQNGICLALCSRNEERDVIKLFQEHDDDFPLSLERDIAAMEINLGKKSDSIERLLRHFDFAPDSVVFIDDRHDECQAVQQKFPTMGVVHLPKASDILRYFHHFWPFDIADSPVDDIDRTDFYQKKSYQQEEEKEQSYATLPDNESTVVHWKKVDSGESPLISRMAALTSKTNQLNFNKTPHTEKELANIINGKEHDCYLFDIEDSINRLDQTGLLIYHIDAPSNILIVDTFLLSCRVMHKGVEVKVLQALFAKAQEENLTAIHLPFKKADRNRPAEQLLQSIVGTTEKKEEALTYYVLPVGKVADSIAFQTPAIDHRPLHAADVPE